MDKSEKTPPRLIYFCFAGSNCRRSNVLIMGLKKKKNHKENNFCSFQLSVPHFSKNNTHPVKGEQRGACSPLVSSDESLFTGEEPRGSHGGDAEGAAQQAQQPRRRGQVPLPERGGEGLGWDVL